MLVVEQEVKIEIPSAPSSLGFMHGRSWIGVSVGTRVAAARSGRNAVLYYLRFCTLPLGLRSRFSEAFVEEDWGLEEAFLHLLTLLFQCFEPNSQTRFVPCFGRLEYHDKNKHFSCASSRYKNEGTYSRTVVGTGDGGEEPVLWPRI